MCSCEEVVANLNGNPRVASGKGEIAAEKRKTETGRNKSISSFVLYCSVLREISLPLLGGGKEYDKD
jgi:hypothetical protein